MVMKRFVLVLLAGALGLSATAALALRQAGAPQGTAASVRKPAVSQVDSRGIEASTAAASKTDSRQIDVPGAASCDPAAMLLAIREEIEIGPPMIWESVTIKQCRNGYARVLAHPGNVPPGTALDDEQVFLRDVDGSWEVITSGSGIACSDEDRLPELKEACEGLGLS
jgi:hypothetical protein